MTMLADLVIAPTVLAMHAPVLLVIAPLLVGAATVLAPSGRFAWYMAVATSAFCLWMGISLAMEVSQNGVVSYHMGGWAPPRGIEFRIDALNSLAVVIISFMGLMSAIYAQPAVEREGKGL